MKTVRKALPVLLALTLLLSLLVSATAATSYDGSGELRSKTVRFSVKPEEVETTQSDGRLVKFHIYVESADGVTPVRAFSFVLNPSDGLMLAEQSKAKSANFWYDFSESAAVLLRSIDNPDGAYGEFGYTSKTKYFAAAGSDVGRGIVNSTEVLCIMGKVDSSAAGSYKLDLVEVVAGDSDESGTTQFTRTVAPAMYAVNSGETHPIAKPSSTGPIKTFTVTLSNKAMTMSNFNAGLQFDRTKLKVTAITTGGGYTALATDAETATLSTVEDANSSGKVGAVFVRAADKTYNAADILTVTFESLKEGETASITPYEDSYGAAADLCVVGTGEVISVKTTLSDFQLGDVNMDGSVDAKDVTALLRHVSKIEYLPNDAVKLGDVNGDLTVGASDVTRLLRYVSKIISSLD